ncbi:MAG: DUF4136 domain-containing protein [Pseudomonadales bacterium]|jgi:hypothetical protein
MVKIFFTTVLFALLSACSSNPPIIDFDSSVDFSKYKTFAFMSEHPLLRAEGGEGGSPLLEGRLMQTTENILAARGFKRVADPESADMAIGFTVGSRDKIQVNSYPETYRPYYGGYGRGWGGAYYGGGYAVGMSTSTTVNQYTEGTLSLDIYDVSTHAPIWHGKATKKITTKMQENPQETVDEIMSSILATFPPI